MKPIDLGRLRDFSDGTDEGVREIAAMFLKHMAECVDSVQKGLDARDAEAVRVEAHRGAGTAGACGARALASLLHDLETHGAQLRLADAAALMPDVERELARLQEFFDSGFEQGLGLESSEAEGQP